MKGIGDWHEIIDETIPNIYSYLNDIPNPSVYLFNIKDDPFEKVNLADKHPVLVKILTAKIEEYKRTTVRKPLRGRIVLRSNPKNWGDKWAPGWC